MWVEIAIQNTDQQISKYFLFQLTSSRAYLISLNTRLFNRGTKSNFEIIVEVLLVEPEIWFDHLMSQRTGSKSYLKIRK